MNPKRKFSIPVRFRLAAVACILLLLTATSAGQAVIDKAEAALGMTDFQDIALDWPCSLHVIRVGKADAMLVMADGEAILIDGGTKDAGDDVVLYLQRLGVQKLAAVINTHPDSDHYGGLPAVLQVFPCAAFYRTVGETEDAYTELQAILERQGVEEKILTAGDTCRFGGLLAEVLSPAYEYPDSNNNSLVLRLTYGETRYLLMGDAEADVEADLLAAGADLSADVLKVGHHGSKTSTSMELLQAISPRFVAISTGEDSSHLPSHAVLRRLEEVKIPTYRTDLHGSLLFCTDGTRLSVYTEKQS